MTNSEDPDEMQHNAAFHQVLLCLLRLKQPSGTKKHHNLEKSTCDPLNAQWAVQGLANNAKMLINNRYRSLNFDLELISNRSNLKEGLRMF